MADQDRRIAETVERERGRLRNFIRRRVAREDVEDVLQDVFFELVEAQRLMNQPDLPTSASESGHAPAIDVRRRPASAGTRR